MKIISLMGLKKAIEEKCGNIGALTSYISHREEMLNELKSFFNTDFEYSIPEMIKSYQLNDFTDKKCICGKKLKWKDFQDGWRISCGDKICITSIRKNSNIEKYGVDNPMKNKNIKDKVIKTLTERYGVDNPMKSDIIIERVKNTNLERYGVENPMKNDDIKNKVRESWNSKTEEELLDIKNRTIATNNAKSDDEKLLIKEKRGDTNLERYGNKTTFLAPSIKEKTIQTNLDRYGVEVAINNKEIRAKIGLIQTEKHIVELKKIIEVDGYSYIKHYTNNNDSIIYVISKDDKEFEISSSNLFFKIKNKIDLKNKFSGGSSNLECNILDYIKSIYNDTALKYRFGKCEIDIYLEKLKLGFEVNGIYWHSEMYKDKNFHLNKTEQCNELGVKLIHIWEDDWLLKNEIVKSRIKNLLNCNDDKVYARKCIIKNVKYKDAKEFLNNNHLQGFVTSKVYLGLYYNNELVSLMTFGSYRKIMNTKKIDKSFELYRFCNKINTTVIGSASKIFKYFLNNYDVNEIVSYSDRCWGDSSIYEKLGFEFVTNSEIGYHWVVDDIRIHRYNFTKDKLVKNGFDPNKTEVEIMNGEGYYRIWNCGNQKWIFKNKK